MISLRELFPEFSKPKAIMQGEIAFQKEKSQCSPDEKEKLYEDSQRQSSSNAIEDITSKLCEGKTTQDDDLGGTILDSSATGKDVKKDCEDQFDEKEEEEIEDGEDGEKEKGEGNEMDLSDLMMTIKM
ncbi:uncharacterized protein MONOS_5386 [Monocercomonoides exilis]|uniref:uncharacterized protein n=1 Tax=Monocercomonoides exilis TaxID=2049356 RepID=UPI003559F856|nr:hypothetical protein MONOS_5386 [Monocercomonoides exilis]|eukprot:MONOS_5386.1-p1 / transcript=MONOS_5386.1 / gene=MONOS_5386 / organism=Monocercomonoides_exilis_PA203 / gene_product=unspecified product / transcript_product=unspecified product / location=Mono_scaffold00156:4540-4968(+) / protein_length=128 / sequence_SO=supercontig / SO=protein_coding / is_pseudo=false